MVGYNNFQTQQTSNSPTLLDLTGEMKCVRRSAHVDMRELMCFRRSVPNWNSPTHKRIEPTVLV